MPQLTTEEQVFIVKKYKRKKYKTKSFVTVQRQFESRFNRESSSKTKLQQLIKMFR